ncbi:MAG: hypothetical protein P8Y28_11140 [Gammaproteobacteria bacterium]
MFAARKAVGILVAKDVAEQPGIKRQPGMQVSFTPIHIARESTLGVG